MNLIKKEFVANALSTMHWKSELFVEGSTATGKERRFAIMAKRVEAIS